MSKATSKEEIREETGENKFFSLMQSLGQTFMLPISILPVAGLLLGIGSSFTNANTIEMYNLGSFLYEGGFLYGIFSIMADAGNIIFGNLGLLFGIAVAFGLAKREQGVAALSAIIGFFVMYASMTGTLRNFRDVEALSETPGLITNYLGFENTMDLGVLGGILIGLTVAFLHNRYNNIELPEIISFFGGTHFVPIISSVAGIILGVTMAFVWPLISGALSSLGGFISGLGVLGIFLYVFIYRALIPFGLHHVFYLPFWQTSVGGTAVVAGETVVGAQNIVFAQLAAGVSIDAHAAAHFSYMFPVMLFGIPAACRAMYEAAHPDNKSEIKGFYTSSALTSFMTGITEPIEFSMLFASPRLYYGVHCVLFGLSGVLVYLLGAGVPVTFSGGVIDFILYGILPGNAQTSWLIIAVVGVAFAFLYYFLFKYGIEKFGWSVPGSDAPEDEEALEIEDVDYEEMDEKEQRAYRIVAGLGGYDNIDNYRNCATRLRANVLDGSKVSKSILEGTGSSGTVVNGNNVQVVYGTTVSNVKASVDELIDSGQAPSESLATSDETTTGDETAEEAIVDEESYSFVEVFAPVNGTLIKMSDVDDPVFGGGMMGDGYAVQPNDDNIVAPISGKVVMVADSKHAIGLETADGLEVLVHMGLDTVDLDGKGFEVLVSEEDEIQADDPIATMDINTIQDEGKGTDVIVALTNTDDKVIESSLLEDEQIMAGEKAGDIKIKE